MYKSFVNLKFTCICAILARVNEEFERMRFSFEYFDTVWHRGLQFKLTQREIPSSIVKILSSYLVNRTGQIKFNGKIGPKFNIKSGVRQGGILSPTVIYLLHSWYTSRWCGGHGRHVYRRRDSDRWKPWQQQRTTSQGHWEINRINRIWKKIGKYKHQTPTKFKN